MPSRSKQKGDRDERALVDAAKAAGLRARRVPLSGAVADFKGDVEIITGNRLWTCECKHRAEGFKQIFGWMADYIDVLTIRADRKPRLVVMREHDFLKLLSEGNGDKS